MSSPIDRIRQIEEQCLVIMEYIIRDRNARLTFAYTYGIFITMVINMLYLHSFVVGLTTLGISAALFGKTFHRAFLRKEQAKFEDVVQGAFIFLAGLSLTIAPFAIFGGTNTILIAALVLLIGIPVSFYRVWFGLHEHADGSITFGKGSWISFLIIASFAILLILDVSILSAGRSDSFGWIWSKIPYSYIYTTFLISLAILPFILLVKIPASTRLTLVLILALMIELYIAVTITTLPGSDNWYMIGEIQSAMTENKEASMSTATTSFGPIAVPQTLVTGWARGFANGLVILLTTITQLDAYHIFGWIAPIFFSIFGTTFMYKIGKRVSGDPTLGIIAALCFLIVPATIFREASTTKLSLSYPLLILGILTWVNYLLTPTRKNLALSIFMTALSFLSYSLFFVALIQVGIMSIFLRNSADTRPNRIISIALIAGLAMIVPLLDTLQDSKFSMDQISSIQNIRATVAERIIELFGIGGPVGSTKEVFDQDFLPLTNQGWLVATIITWFFTVIGAISLKRINKQFFYLVLSMFVVSHLSFFIATQGMVGVHALGAYQNTLVELFQIPLISAGIYELIRILHQLKNHQWLQRKSPSHYHTIIRFARPVIASLTILSIGFAIITSQTIETKFTNLTQGEVDAARFVANTDSTYAMISDLNVASALYAFSDGKIDGGGFNVVYIPGVSTDVRTEFYLYQVVQASSVVDAVEQARREADVCTVHIVIPSYFGLDENGIKRLADNLGDPLTFGREGKTKLFTYTNCPDN